MSEEYKILYKEYEIAYKEYEGIASIEVKDNETGKIYHSKFKLFKVIKELQQELTKYKERCESLSKQLQNIINEFLKYNWKEATQEQTYNQLKSLYESILQDKE